MSEVQGDGAQIGLEARILAGADRFDALTHDTPDGAAIPAERAAKALVAEAGLALAPDVVEALLSSLDLLSAVPRAARQQELAGLTAREVEVLRLEARRQRGFAVCATAAGCGSASGAGSAGGRSGGDGLGENTKNSSPKPASTASTVKPVS